MCLTLRTYKINVSNSKIEYLLVHGTFLIYRSNWPKSEWMSKVSMIRCTHLVCEKTVQRRQFLKAISYEGCAVGCRSNLPYSYHYIIYYYSNIWSIYRVITQIIRWNNGTMDTMNSTTRMQKRNWIFWSIFVLRVVIEWKLSLGGVDKCGQNFGWIISHHYQVQYLYTHITVVHGTWYNVQLLVPSSHQHRYKIYQYSSFPMLSPCCQVIAPGRFLWMTYVSKLSKLLISMIQNVAFATDRGWSIRGEECKRHK